ncbi:MAG: pirin family protein [Planctomycetota bacterium]
MIEIRRSADRGHLVESGLESWHTFSFGNYHDPEHMMFRQLRVLCEATLAPGTRHRNSAQHDMEILTYVLGGELQHRDGSGRLQHLGRGEMQRLSTAAGSQHQIINASDHEPLKLFQIWIYPEVQGLPPGYQRLGGPVEIPENSLRLVATRNGQSETLTVHQDTRMWLGKICKGKEIRHAIDPGRQAWLQVLRGAIAIGTGASDTARPSAAELEAGDGVAIRFESHLRLYGFENAEIMLFELV